MQRYALIIEYDGTKYCGWQKQAHCESVQERVELSLSRVADAPVCVTASGRTDTAVHAFAQCVHFDTEAQRENKAWVLGVNARLPADISVRSVTRVSSDFHARYSTTGRTYRYIIQNHAARSALMHKRVAVVYPQLNAEAMSAASKHLIGEHDYSSFRAAGCQAKHAVREITSIAVRRIGHCITIEVCGNAFLHNMVRIIVGSLIRVGRGEESTHWLYKCWQLATAQRRALLPRHMVCISWDLIIRRDLVYLTGETVSRSALFNSGQIILF